MSATGVASRLVPVGTAFALALAAASLAGRPPSPALADEGGTVTVPGRAGPGADAARTAAERGERLLTAEAAARTIDREVARVLEREGLEPTGPADDAEFLRRVWLDVAGVPPNEEEVRAFLSAKDPDRRQATVERLLQDPLYGDHVADRWGKILFSGLRRYRYEDRRAVQEWLAGHFQEGRGVDALVRELLTATGNSRENPALAYTLRFADGGIPADIAGVTSRIFLGVQIQCAQCHDHPYESWTMGDFAGMAAFFNLVQPRRADPMDPRAGFVVEDPDPRRLARAARRGGTGADIRGATSASPRFLGGAEHRDRAGTPRRAALAAWIVSPGNPWFARATVNRVWSWFFGRGLVNPVDDFRSDNPPTHPEVLSSLAVGFAESGYDLRFLVRAITLSETYARTSRLPAGGVEDDIALRRLDRLYARGPVKPLTADQVFDSVLRATGMDDAFRRSNRRQIERMREALFRQFTTEIEDDEMTDAEQWAGTIPQGLLLMNGPLTQIGTRAGGPQGRRDRIGFAARENTLNGILSRTKETAARVRGLYLATLGRFPAEEEAAAAASFAARGRGDDGWEDLFWALLNSSEFMSNH